MSTTIPRHDHENTDTDRDRDTLARIANDDLDAQCATVHLETVIVTEHACTDALDRNYGDSAGVAVSDVTGGGMGGVDNQAVSAVFRTAYERGLPIGAIEVRQRRAGSGGVDLWIIGKRVENTPESNA
jgi:hypothetical protein